MPQVTTTGWTGLSVKTAALAVSLFACSVAGKRTCDTSIGNMYPYCVNVPDGASDGQKFPTVLFLQGRGARGPASQLETLSTYDGFGKLVSEYQSGNTDEVHTLAATKFITIVPVAPSDTGSSLDPQWWYPERVDKVVQAVTAKYPVDMDRFHVSGYSMGGKGAWRYAVYRPDIVASLVSSGGDAETNSIVNSEGQTVEPVSEQLDKLANLKTPIRAFVGSQDVTVVPTLGEATQAKMESLGDTNSKITILNTDHSGLSVGPFTADLLNWMLKQSLSGASSSSSSSTTSSSSSSSPKSTSTSGSGSGSGSRTSSSSNPASTSSTTKKKCTRRRKRSQSSARTHRPRSLTLAKILANREKTTEL